MIYGPPPGYDGISGMRVDTRGWTGGVGYGDGGGGGGGGLMDGYGQVHFAQGGSVENGPTYNSYDQSFQYNPSQAGPFQNRADGRFRSAHQRRQVIRAFSFATARCAAPAVRRVWRWASRISARRVWQHSADDAQDRERNGRDIDQQPDRHGGPGPGDQQRRQGRQRRSPPARDAGAAASCI